MPATKTDYYQTLGVPRTADEDEIRKAYRRLARKYHPDVNPGDKTAEDRFKAVQEAYDVLSDKRKRQLFDQFGFYSDNMTAGGPGASPGGAQAPPGFDFSGFDFGGGPFAGAGAGAGPGGPGGSFRSVQPLLQRRRGRGGRTRASGAGAHAGHRSRVRGEH
jgi:molecular chaperone DnaJ